MRKYQYYNTGDDSDRDSYTTNWIAQTFTVEQTHLIGKVKLKLFRAGDPDTITVSIKLTSAGKPVGADLCSGTIEGTDLTENTSGEWYEITLGDGAELEKDIQYSIIVRAPDGDASNKVSWRADITDPILTGGTFCSSSDSGIDWSTYSGIDCMFEEWGTGPPSPTTVTWGNLLKSQISSERIEAAISRLIQDHEDDPNAHVEAGESLHSHKASEIIDHVINSIIYDKIANFSIDLKKMVGNQYMLMTCFESKDGWNSIDGDVGYIVSANIFGLMIQTNTDADDEAIVASEPSITDPVIKFTKDSFFQTTFRCSYTTTQLIYACIGNTSKGYGFKVSNGTLYAFHNNLVGEITTEITGITLNLHNIYRAVFDTTAGEIYFYINGTLKATHDTGLPTTTTTFVFMYYVQTTAAVKRIIEVRDLIISQTR